MPNEKCPPSDQLQAFLCGQLAEDSIDEIAAHLEACPPCEETVATLEQRSDTILGGLRRPQRSQVSGDAQYRQALSFVKQIGRDATIADDDASPANDGPSLGNLREYILLEKLGEGGMGAVYKARHSKLDKVVAIKVLPKDKLNDAQAIARFEREMRAVGQLEHPNIVRAMDAGHVDGTHFLVMEYVEGVDLSQLVKQHGPLPIADACELIRQAAIGLDEAHDHGMVHRDIKPSNIMLASGGRKPTDSASRRKKRSKASSSPTVKILDLGLALLDETQSPDTEALTGSGQMMGTLDYMAPEQGGDTHGVDIRADIYSLGATLYKLLTGQAIYHGSKYATPVQKMMALATQPAQPIQERRAEVPDELAAIVHRMLEKDPNKRFATPDEVADALVPFCNAANLVGLLAGNVTLDESDSETPRSATDLAASNPSVDTDSDVPPPAITTTYRPQTAARRRVPTKVLIASGAALLGIVALLAAMVFFFPTPHGTLRVEINDPDVEVKVKGQNIVLTNANKEPIKLKAGDHSLIVTRGDFTFETKQFTLKKGETTVVKVELLPGKVEVVSAGEVIGSRNLASTVGQESARPARTALLFDGESTYVDIRTLKFDGSHPITLECYVTPNRGNLNSNVIGDHWDTGITLRTAREGYYGFTVGPAPDMDRSNAEESLAVGQRVHLAATWDKDGLRLFVNGKQVASTPTTKRVYQPSARWFAIGRYIAGGGHFSGTIDEVRVSNTTRYTKDFIPGEDFEPDEHTLALYHFDEGEGDVLHDSSGNGHDGKILGAKWVNV